MLIETPPLDFPFRPERLRVDARDKRASPSLRQPMQSRIARCLCAERLRGVRPTSRQPKQAVESRRPNSGKSNHAATKDKDDTLPAAFTRGGRLFLLRRTRCLTHHRKKPMPRTSVLSRLPRTRATNAAIRGGNRAKKNCRQRSDSKQPIEPRGTTRARNGGKRAAETFIMTDFLIEMSRFLVVIERAEAEPAIWERLTRGTGIATANAYRTSLAEFVETGLTSRQLAEQRAALLNACELTRRWMIAGQPAPYSDSQLLEILDAAIAQAKGESA